MSAFNSFIKREYIIYSDEFLKDEIDHIIKIAIDYGYSSEVIPNKIKKYNSYLQDAS